MKTRNSLFLVPGLIATSAAIALSQAPAQAASFTANNLSDRTQCAAGSVTCNINDFFQLYASPEKRQITQKNVNGIWGFGVATNGKNPIPNDPSWGEIDPGESLHVDFKNKAGTAFSGILESLQLSFLYQPGVFNDKVFEVALVSDKNETIQGSLQVVNSTTANWIFNGITTISSVSASTSDKGGSYIINNPFKDKVLSGFRLTAKALNPVCGTTPCPAGADSDFTLTAAKVRRVPEPATLLGLGAVGLLAFTQRRRSVKAN